MLQITNVKLHNICQHSDISVDIHTGLMAICGYNGSGKTTILRALMYGLTGLVDGSWGYQQSLQKDGTTDPGYVEVTIEDTSLKYIIRRWSVSNPGFPDTVSSVTEDATEIVARRRKDVDRFLESLYGVSCQLLFTMCWGRQGHLDMLLVSPATLVNAFLACVFDTKYLDSYRDKLKHAVDSIAAYQDRTVDIKEAEDSIAQLPSVEDLNDAIHSIEEQLAIAEPELDVLLNTHRNEMSIAKWTEETNKLKSSIDVKLQTVSDLNAKGTSDIKPEYDLDYINDRLIATDGFIKSLVDCINVYSNELISVKAQLDKNIKEKNDLISFFTSVKAKLCADTKCALCGHSVESNIFYINNKCELLTSFKSFEIFEKDTTNKIANIDSVIDSTNKAICDLDKKIKDAEIEKQKYSQDKEALLKDKHIATLYENHKSVIALQDDIMKLTESLNRLKATKPLSQEDTDKITALYTHVANLKAEKDEKTKMLIDTASKQKYLNTRLVDLKKEADLKEINDQARSLLLEIRDAFSANRVQARYINSKIDAINNLIDYYMVKTNMPFNLFLNKSTHVFEYTTKDGYTHPSTHLSGAQKNISAVIIQMAILEVLHPNINIFLLDEPSESLDIENKRIMADLLQVMNNLLPTINGSMIIVSRDDQLIESCNNVYTLEDKCM